MTVRCRPSASSGAHSHTLVKQPFHKQAVAPIVSVLINKHSATASRWEAAPTDLKTGVTACVNRKQ